ncbi:N-acetyltransferase eso1 [Galdieria sulphuraria]|nr:N-acetyltransferase eso1 [Galdieria sulphuraria]
MASDEYTNFAHSDLEQFPVIIHLDLDCFYAQVESVRLGLDPSTPLCVQQWDGVIAVNYAAREYGISRHERIEKVKEKCPNCVLVHVETVGFPDQSSSRENVSNPDLLNHGKSETKVSLDRYREASAKIFQLLFSYSELCEKASIDEAYLDVSEQVQDILVATRNQRSSIGSIFEQLSMTEKERAYFLLVVQLQQKYDMPYTLNSITQAPQELLKISSWQN